MNKKQRWQSSGALVGIFALIAVLIGLVVIKLQPELKFLTIKPEQRLDVPIENQWPDLPNGCEVTSLSMLLRYYGINVTKEELAHNIAHVPSYDGKFRGNPNQGFVGVMNQANGGWCVYAPALYNLGNKYTSRITDASGEDFKQIIELVSSGHPVLIITTLHFKPVNDIQTWKTRQGKVRVTPSSHACVITGYNKKKQIVYVNDPYGYKDKVVKWKDIEASFNQQGKQALYID